MGRLEDTGEQVAQVVEVEDWQGDEKRSGGAVRT